MTTTEIKEMYEKDLAFSRSQAEWHTKQIARLNEYIKRERAYAKEIIEMIWAKGVITEWDYKAWIEPKDPLTVDGENYRRQRANDYKWRKHYLARVAYLENYLATH